MPWDFPAIYGTGGWCGNCWGSCPSFCRMRRFGWEVIAPASGRLACGAVGAGKLPEPEVLKEYVLRHLALEKDMQGLRVLVTAGPTQEALDPVRFLTNHSSGKMG